MNLIKNVYAKGPKGQAQWVRPGDEIPDWALEVLAKNPSLWDEAPEPEPKPEVEPEPKPEPEPEPEPAKAPTKPKRAPRTRAASKES